MPKTYINARGNQVQSCRNVDANRYNFDYGVCAAHRGWDKYETEHDHDMFGVWVCATGRRVLVFCEGDSVLTNCSTPESFKAELDNMAARYGAEPHKTTEVYFGEVFGHRPHRLRSADINPGRWLA